MSVLLAASLFLSAQHNTLSTAEKEQGWRLLFDGQTTKGWRNYQAQGINKGWQVVDGSLVVADPEHAGDIVTTGQYKWFELKIAFKYEPGQNSGIMFHVKEEAEAAWHSGPEIQIYDHALEPGVETTGFLYQLYTCDRDHSRPAGQWNEFHIVVSGNGCSTWLNGHKLYDYQLGSDDFWARVAKSKFSKYEGYARAGEGHIAIQGDHGHVAFRDIKLRVLED